MGKTLYKLFSLGLGLAGGLIAGSLFQQLWKRVGRNEEDAPDPTDEDHPWREILPAAVLRGAVVGGVRAVIARGAAIGIKRITGSWPTS
ncbi:MULTISPECIES: DUF4235 domain-containing protein [Streptomyces]|uniref:DUF4235 domain-containing protein n=1 Tax=Streptomyces TaxID=1883 RepID=UPI001F466C5B|nr:MULTISPECIES: DUF4235 domain-containing protein [Streptomyces]